MSMRGLAALNPLIPSAICTQKSIVNADAQYTRHGVTGTARALAMLHGTLLHQAPQTAVCATQQHKQLLWTINPETLIIKKKSKAHLCVRRCPLVTL